MLSSSPSVKLADFVLFSGGVAGGCAGAERLGRLLSELEVFDWLGWFAESWLEDGLEVFDIIV